MRVENPDALKKWLVSSLGPICSERLCRSDLAKYILTLVKNDKPEEQLKKICIEQLDIFLEKKTESFVNGLFETLKDRSYLSYSTGANSSSTDAGPQSTSETTGPAKSWSQEKSEKRRNLQVIKESSKEQSQGSRGALRSVIGNSSGLVSRLRNGNSSSGNSGRRKSNEGTDEQTYGKVTRQEKHTWDSLEDEDANKLKRLRTDTTSRNSNGIDQRSSYSGQKRPLEESNSSKSYSSSSPTYSPTYSVKKAREGTKSSKGQKSQHSDYKNSYDDANVPQQSYEHVETVGSSSKNITTSAIPSNDGRQKEGKKQGRCHDYDERGFCVRGDECPFDHGNDPLVVEGAPLTGFDASVLQAAPTFNYGSHAGLATGPQAPVILPQIQPLPSAQQLPSFNSGLLPPGIPTYDPKSPAMYQEKDIYNGGNSNPYWPSHPPYPPPQDQSLMMHHLAGEIPPYDPTRPPPPFHTHAKPYRPRELINVPTTDRIHSTSQNEDGMVSSSSSSQTKVAPLKEKNRESPNKRLMAYCRSTPGCVLKLTGIPRHLNAVQHLSVHFQKFGKVESILTNIDSDPQSALVYFTKPSEAAAAVRFKGAIFGNKLIKVSLYEKSPEKPTCSETAASSSTSIESLPQTSTKPNEVKPIVNEPVSTKVAVPPNAVPPKNFDLRNVLNSRKNRKSFSLNAHQQLRERQEMIKKKHDLQKQKQKVLQQYIQNQKMLLNKLSVCTNPAQCKEYKKLLNEVMEKTQKLQSEMRSGKDVPKKLPDSVSNPSPEKKMEVETQPIINEVDSSVPEDKEQEEISEEMSEEIKLNKMMFEVFGDDDDDEDSDDGDRSWRR